MFIDRALGEFNWFLGAPPMKNQRKKREREGKRKWDRIEYI
jgi:hypothetical protein